MYEYRILFPRLGSNEIRRELTSRTIAAERRRRDGCLRSKGNLKEMERELGISYPTVRARVDALLRALGLADGAAVEDDSGEPTPGDAAGAVDAAADALDMAAARRKILERLARREIDAASAAAELRGLGG